MTDQVQRWGTLPGTGEGLPMLTPPGDITREERWLLSGTVFRQGEHARHWARVRNGFYHRKKSPVWTVNQCRMAAVIDLLAWQQNIDASSRKDQAALVLDLYHGISPRDFSEEIRIVLSERRADADWFIVGLVRRHEKPALMMAVENYLDSIWEGAHIREPRAFLMSQLNKLEVAA